MPADVMPFAPGEVKVEPGDPSAKIQTYNNFRSDIKKLKHEQMPLVLDYTHEDLGRLRASKLFHYLQHLIKIHHHYSSKRSKNQNDINRLRQAQELGERLSLLVQDVTELGLDSVDETFLERFHKLGEDIHNLRRIEIADTHINAFGHASLISNIFLYLTIVASYLTKTMQGFLKTLPTVLSWLGTIFPPIIVAVDAAKNIFDLIYSLMTRLHLQKRAREHTHPSLATASIYNLGYYLRQAGNIIALGVNIFTLLIFTGALLSSPLGWAISTIVVAAEWVTSCAVPAWQAWRNYRKLQSLTRPDLADNIQKLKASLLEINKAITALEKQRLEKSGKEYFNLSKRIFSLYEEKDKIEKELAPLEAGQKKLDAAKENYLAKVYDAFWYSSTIVGSALFACGFLCPPLFVFGVLFLAASPSYSVLFFLHGRYVKWDKARTLNPAQEPESDHSKVMSTAHIGRDLLIDFSSPLAREPEQKMQASPPALKPEALSPINTPAMANLEAPEHTPLSPTL